MPPLNRKPHNNRVSTSSALKTSDIWSKTIGHDPYASSHENRGIARLDDERAKSLLELARHQNLALTSSNQSKSLDEYARKMFLGLKGGKKRRVGENSEDVENDIKKNALKLLQEDETSSSEDEFVDATFVNMTAKNFPTKDIEGNDKTDDEAKKRTVKRRKKRHVEKSRKQRKRSKRSGSSSSSSSSSSDNNTSSDAETSSSSDESRLKHRRRRKDKRHTSKEEKRKSKMSQRHYKK